MYETNDGDCEAGGVGVEWVGQAKLAWAPLCSLGRCEWGAARRNRVKMEF